MGEIQGQPFQLDLNAPPKAGIRDSRIAPDGALVALREHSKCTGFFRQLFLLVCQKNSWSPALITGEFWRYLTNIGMRREVLRLLKLRPYAEITQKNPGFAFKYLAPNYLARSFTLTERVSCFLHHYRRIHAALPESILRQILQGYITLHEIAEGGNRFAFTMGLPEPKGHLEGELSLDLRVDGKKVFNLSFTIVPGSVVKSKAAEILFITRLQGTKGSLPQIRLARKAFHEFFPGKLLLATLQGIAEALGIGEIEAVCVTKQSSYTKVRSAIFKNRYDDFFAELGMVKTAGGFYSSPVPVQGRPLASFRGRNRLRARKRRIIRQQIQAACAALLLGATDRAAASTSGRAKSTPITGAVESRPSPHFLSHTRLRSNSST
jgi:uncharacterized protein VirK/YbjX